MAVLDSPVPILLGMVVSKKYLITEDIINEYPDMLYVLLDDNEIIYNKNLSEDLATPNISIEFAKKLK